jgi:hypothetical protein
MDSQQFKDTAISGRSNEADKYVYRWKDLRRKLPTYV